MAKEPTKTHDFSQKELEALRKAFDSFDEDKGGTIDSNELGNIMAALGREINRAEIETMIATVDPEKTGEISFDNFVKLMWSRKQEQKQHEMFRAAFRTFNASGTGKLSLMELRVLMSQIGRQLSDEELDEMMFEADEDKDHHLNFDEFVAIMQRAATNAPSRRGWDAEHLESIENWKAVTKEIGAILSKGSYAQKCIRPSRAFRPPKYQGSVKTESSRVLQPVLSAAREGDTILLEPGKYTEPIVMIHDGITLGANLNEGERPANTDPLAWAKQRASGVILEVNCKNPAVTIKTRYCRLVNITIINKGGPAIVVEQGYCDIEGCAVTGETDGIVIRNRSFPQISNCTIKNCRRGCGINIRESRAIIEDCTIEHNNDGGLVAERSSNPWVSRCRFANGQGSGIVFVEGALGIICECRIFRNGTQGVLIQHQSNPILWKNSIEKGRASGVKVIDGGRGTVAECMLDGNEDHDVDISRDGNPVIFQNTFKGGPTAAIAIYDRASAVIEGNSFQAYGISAVTVSNLCYIVAVNNVFHTVPDSAGTNTEGVDTTRGSGMTLETNITGKLVDNSFIGWKPGYVRGRAALQIKDSPGCQSIRNVVQETAEQAEAETIVNLLGVSIGGSAGAQPKKK